MPSNLKEKSRHAASKNGGSLISNQKLRLLYSTMLKCRLFDERVGQLFGQKKLVGSYASSIGQEASAVGAAIDLRRMDAVTVSREDSIAQLVKGAPLDVIFSQLYARYSKPASGAKKNAPESGSTMAAQLNMVAGLALSNKMQKNESVVVAFVQEGAPSLEESHEPLNFAAKQQLPILFVALNGIARRRSPKLRRLAFIPINMTFPASPWTASTLWRCTVWLLRRWRVPGRVADQP